ncbi:MAG: sigma-54-dependent transcriptional regulator [Bacteroidales bacterium]
MKRILIIDDDTYICKLLDKYLSKNGYETETALNGAGAVAKLKASDFDLVLSDYRLPDKDGFYILNLVKSRNPTVPVIIMTAYEEMGTAIKLIKSGATDYITKPLIPEEVLGLIKEAMTEKVVEDDSVSFQQDFIPGRSRIFLDVLDHIRIVAPVNMTVIIQGETGSGKEHLARAIHFNSKRKNGPFIAVDCGALPKGVVNSELFGHIKGSFTGATFDKKGLFEQASGGTLFLDEISNLDAENQMKLLRVLQEKTVTRIGDTRSIKVDVRLIVASNEDLLEEMRKGNIREDLYHRLNEFKMVVPPLREREEDVLIFADAFIQRASSRFQKKVSGYDDAVRQILLDYHWPGNIRELRNVITRAVLLTKNDRVTMSVIPEEIRTRQALHHHMDKDSAPLPRDMKLKDAATLAEKEAIIQALVKSNYNKSQAARLLKIDRKTLYNKIKQLNMSLVDK